MRLRAKILLLILVIIVLVVVRAVYFVRYVGIESAVDKDLENALGVPVDIQKFEASPLFVSLGFNEMTISNPPGFKEKEMAYISRLQIVIDPLECALNKEPNIFLLILNIDRLNIIRHKDGKVNIEELKIIQDIKNEKTLLPFHPKAVVLSLGELNFIDYKSSVKGVSKKYNLGIKNQIFYGLEDGDEVVKLVVAKVIENTDLGKVINLSVKPVYDIVNTSWGMVKSNTKAIWSVATWPFKFLLPKP